MSQSILVRTLIREELRNRKLIHSLEDMGFDCSYYIIDLSKEILELSGFKNFSEKHFKWYFDLTSRAIEEINSNNFSEMLEKWTDNIFDSLMKKRTDY